jgi:MFS transporter, putative metabolite:H+ symporter
MTLLVSALGYFIDIFDLTLFSIVRIPSIESLGVPPGEALAAGARILNLQQAGLLIGGIVWGMWGDRKGRVTVLFGSIFLYSSATLASALVTSIPAYGITRFIAGFGLAAELGAAVTLVGESMSRKSRGWGTALIASTGLLGAVAAALTAGNLSWRMAYIAGGVLGLLLLFGRISVRESGIFRALTSRPGIRRGDLLLLLSSPGRMFRYALCVLAGLPICASIGVLVYFSPELARSAGAKGAVSAGTAVMCAYLGMSLGDLGCSGLSPALKSKIGRAHV